MSKHDIDPFYISGFKVTFFDNKGCMYLDTSFYGDFKYFEGNSKELEEFAVKELKLSRDTKSLKIVEIQGFDNITNYESYLNIVIEEAQMELDDAEPWGDSKPEKYSFFLDDR